MLAWLAELYRRHLKRDIGSYAMIGAFFLVFHTTAYASYFIPTESMVPTLETGDHIEVSKFAYGFSRYSVPFALAPSLTGKDGRIFEHAPARGDVVVFSHPRTHETMIKRLIGLPDDRIQLVHGRLFINGKEVARRFLASHAYRDAYGRVVEVGEYEESLPDGRPHKIYEQTDNGFADNTAVYVVPAGHLFMMGDNRDDSADSRFLGNMGYVPIENVVGRADLITFTFHRCLHEAGLTCPKGRFLARVD